MRRQQLPTLRAGEKELRRRDTVLPNHMPIPASGHGRAKRNRDVFRMSSGQPQPLELSNVPMLAADSNILSEHNNVWTNKSLSLAFSPLPILTLTGRRDLRVEGGCEGKHGPVGSVSAEEQRNHGGGLLRQPFALR